MTSGTINVLIRKAQKTDIDSIKEIADAHKNELGFVRRPTIEKSINANEIFVAVQITNQSIVGFVHYHHRKDGQTTLYNIVVITSFRLSGIATKLVSALENEARSQQSTRIVLKCPVELRANEFYGQYGFSLATRENGKHRPLNIWRLNL
jgi:N-acetylglutamate synthase-like GNAT family acetyltransferase